MLLLALVRASYAMVADVSPLFVVRPVVVAQKLSKSDPLLLGITDSVAAVRRSAGRYSGFKYNVCASINTASLQLGE